MTVKSTLSAESGVHLALNWQLYLFRWITPQKYLILSVEYRPGCDWPVQLLSVLYIPLLQGDKPCAVNLSYVSESEVTCNLLSGDSTKGVWSVCLVRVLSKWSGHFQCLLPNPQVLLCVHRLLPLFMSGWRNPRWIRPMIWAGWLVCRCIENFFSISWYAAIAVLPELWNILSKWACCHVFLRQD